MVKVLVIRSPESGIITKMARAVASGVEESGGQVLEIAPREVSHEALVKADAIIVGSPCHMGSVDTDVKRFLDSTYPLRGKLEGKVGGAFATSRHIAGGSELTLMTILAALLLHGIIVQGDVEGDPYGPVIVNPTGELQDLLADDWQQCCRLGRRVTALAKRLGRG